MAKQKFNLAFSSAAAMEFLGDVPLTEIGTFMGKLTFRQTLEIAHLALKDGARLAGNEYEASFTQTCDLLDKHPELLKSAIDAFNNSISNLAGSVAGNVEAGE
jgi:hypothetical protein